MAMADTSGVVSTAYTFEPFGATTTTGAPSSNALQFTGRENDGTGLFAYRARYYAPAIGRFLSEDPVSDAERLRKTTALRDDLDAYTYARDNPVRWTDPQGTGPQSLIGPILWIPEPNGNLVGGNQAGFQDNRCTVPGFGNQMDKNRCIKNCCQAHDNCYADNGCNYSSWLVWPRVGPCNSCNIRAMKCVFWSAGLPRNVNPCGCPAF